jgi:hypothetical protein
MEQTNFIIYNFVEQLSGDSTKKLEQLKNNLKKENIHYKDYPDDGLILIFNDYNKKNKSELERECRSTILNRDTLEIVSYSCDDPLCNAEAKHYLLNNNMEDSNQTIYQCYEGSLLSIYNFNGKWNISTRKCLDSSKSIWKNEKSHYTMLLETLESIGVNSINDFTSKLNSEYCYYFVLVHHENINVINYKNKFGENYKKIILAFVRNMKSQEEIDIYNEELYTEIIENDIRHKIQRPEKYSDMSILEDENNKGFINIPAENEGLLIKIDNKGSKKTQLLKFQTSDYLFGVAVGPDKNIYKGFLKLYQTNNLSEYLQNNRNFEKYKKIINPNNQSETFDTVGTVDAVFKVCTSESYELFKLLWDIKTGQHKSKELYNFLPKEYKDLLFAIRGIYFEKKAEYITNKKNNSLGQKIQRSVLKISDIYELFKSYDINKLEKFLKARRLMFNLIMQSNNNENLQRFKTISIRCDSVLIKLITIYSIQLFPNLTENDLPELKVSTNNNENVSVVV